MHYGRSGSPQDINKIHRIQIKNLIDQNALHFFDKVYSL